MRGVCVVALGYHIYGEMAFNLAASLRVVNPNIQIALLHDEKGIETLTDEHLELFDQSIEIEGGEITVTDSKHYQFAKLLVYKYSPFDFTIYIDADTLWCQRSIDTLFEEYKSLDFMVGAHSTYDLATQKHSILGYTYWCRPYEACVYHNLTYIQQTISGLFYFKKGEIAKRIFDVAQEVYLHEGTPNFTWANGKPDEYCFSVALAKLGIKIDRNTPIYFDKLHGKSNEQYMFENFYGIAIGGHKITHELKQIYNKRAAMSCERLGLKAFVADDKIKSIAARGNEKNAVLI